MTTATVYSYREVLAAAGYPLDVVVIDYESYYNGDFTLTKLSTIEYVKDKRFECLGVAIAESKSPICHWCIDARSAIETLQAKYGASLEGVTVLAWNSRFDLTILKHMHGFVPMFHIDLVSVARSVHPQFSAKLKDVAAFYGLKPKGKTSDFKGATRVFRTVRQGGRGKKKDEMIVLPRMNEAMELALGEYAIHDSELELDLFYRMLPKFSRPELELRVQQHTTEQFLDSVLCVDIERADRIRRDMLNEVTIACEATGHLVKDISGNHSFRRLLTSALAVVGEELPLKESPTTGLMIPALAATDPARDRLLEHFDPTVAALTKARVAIRSWPSKAKRVHNIIKQATVNGGVLPVPLHYYGAHTGRWSGAESINLQNLGTRGHPLDAEVRNVLLPPTGHVLIVADQAAVEARGTAWLAGQDDLLAIFREGRDVYCEFASKMFPFTVRPPRDTDPAPIARKLKAARNCGKVGVLGGGYGMGPLKCQTFANGFGLTLSFDDAAEIINTYRSTYPKIVKFSLDIYSAFLWTHRTGRESNVGPIHIYQDYYAESVDVVVVLPSGRELRYANVGEQQGDRGPELICYSPRKKTWSKIYGGYLTENIVQALCRDTLAETVLYLEEQAIRVPLTVHDEVVCVVSEEYAEKARHIILDAMRTSPVWAPDLPLDAEATIMTCYGK